jgi:molybdenum cofactor synthesis domain-containing protein
MSSANEPAAGGQGAYRVWVLTASDRGARGEREDSSGKLAREIAEGAGFVSSGYTLLSDDQEGIEREIRRICDNGLADLILTTGGTGFSDRDRVPEATLAAAERAVPGIPEAMRQQSLAATKRAMLSRAAAAIRGKTLIVNLPGSPRAVQENLGFIIAELRHGLDILSGCGGDCGRP